ncbi:unnamed protein product [Gemmataceae bacterium]|nr:unnamed protein product [Gemmataceae bacterium]VTU00733.1 unnamed protein product [Gemmataceae bacterium]
MIERDAFLAALAENEDDTTTRLVYADWLDEQGEHDEADRQRKWPAAKEWLVGFCAANNHGPDEEDPYEWVISYADLLELGREAVAGADKDGFGFSCGNNMTMCDALRDNSAEFWRNWSIVTGVPLPPGGAERGGFHCAC